jgi:hypothetical protein
VLFTNQTALWQHLTQHWLRLVVPDEQANRSRWPMDLTWVLLHKQYGLLANAEPLEEKSQLLVRGACYTGKSRLQRRMLLGVVDSLEVEDAAPASSSLALPSELSSPDGPNHRPMHRAQGRLVHLCQPA